MFAWNWFRLLTALSFTFIAGNDGRCRTLPSECESSVRDKDFMHGPSVLSSQPGHWPSSYCRLSNVYFNTALKTFFVGIPSTELLDKCYGLHKIWKFSLKNNSIINNTDNSHCDQIFQIGHVFTLYYYHGSNYFHLHYDTIIPLYASLHYKKPTENAVKNVVLIPSVETKRGESIDWNTNAFLDDSNYWMEALKVLADPYRILPLDHRLAAMQKTMCFKEIVFGTPKVNYSSEEFIHNYVTFIKKRLNVRPEVKPSNTKTRVGLIHRSSRRKILNEEDLTNILENDVQIDLVEFTGRSFKEQVQLVQQYDILIGMNGAGLMNALYLPPSSIAIQLIPYEAQLNFEEYKKLLMTRGPYLEWKNNYSNLSLSLKEDLYNNTSDTIVHVEEFKQLVARALRLLDTIPKPSEMI